MARKTTILPRILTAFTMAVSLLLVPNSANSEDLPLKGGLYVTDQKYCAFTEDQKINLGDAAGVYFRTLGNGKIDNNYESVCAIKDVRVNGSKITFKTVCSAEGETDEYDNLYTKLSNTSYEDEGTTYSICEPSFVSQLSIEQIMNVQTILINLGFSPGTPDGKIGPNTNRAMNAFQRQKGLKTTSELNKNTYDLLISAGNGG